MLSLDGRASDSRHDARIRIDADVSSTVYRSEQENGSARETTVAWFGHERHLAVDENYELDVTFHAAKASSTR
jgi:hypothetical protein